MLTEKNKVEKSLLNLLKWCSDKLYDIMVHNLILYIYFHLQMGELNY